MKRNASANKTTAKSRKKATPIALPDLTSEPSIQTEDSLIESPHAVFAIPQKHSESNIFEMSSSRGQMIKNWFDSLRHMLHKDVNFVFDKTGINVSHFDEPKNVAIVSRLYGREFESYFCERRISAGINVASIYKIVKWVVPNELFSIHIARSKPGTLVISMINTNHQCKSVHNYDLIDEIDDDEVELPDYEFSRSMTIPSQPFQRKVHEMSHFDFIEIRSIRNNLILRPYLSDTLETTFRGKIRVMVQRTSADSNDVPLDVQDNATEEAAEIYQGVFNVKHICEFVKKPGICDEMTFYVKNDNPLLIEYTLSTLGYLRIIIMPHKPDSTPPNATC
jgi:proliferating cell nuclear antigen